MRGSQKVIALNLPWHRQPASQCLRLFLLYSQVLAYKYSRYLEMEILSAVHEHSLPVPTTSVQYYVLNICDWQCCMCIYAHST